jgi:hypothetical protein
MDARIAEEDPESQELHTIQVLSFHILCCITGNLIPT